MSVHALDAASRSTFRYSRHVRRGTSSSPRSEPVSRRSPRFRRRPSPTQPWPGSGPTCGNAPKRCASSRSCSRPLAGATTT